MEGWPSAFAFEVEREILAVDSMLWRVESFDVLCFHTCGAAESGGQDEVAVL